MKKTSILVILALFPQTDAMRLGEPGIDTKNLGYNSMPQEQTDQPNQYDYGNKIYKAQNNVNYPDVSGDEQTVNAIKTKADLERRYKHSNQFAQTDQIGGGSDDLIPTKHGWQSSEQIERELEDRRRAQIHEDYQHEQEEKERKKRSLYPDGTYHSPDGRRWYPSHGYPVEYVQRYTMPEPEEQPKRKGLLCMLDPQSCDESNKYTNQDDDQHRGILCILDPASCKENKKPKFEPVYPPPRLGPDGLWHSADGTKFFPDGQTEVAGVNIYLQTNETEQPIIQHIQLERQDPRSGSFYEAWEQTREQIRQNML